MKSDTPMRALALLASVLAFPALARAHSADSLVYDCAAGIAHPLHGWDHVLAMVAVGLWAAQLGGRARWLLPTAFVTIMTCSAWLGSRGLAWSGVEPMIAVSVLALGGLIAATVRLPLVATVAIVSVFAAAHGAAHGAEIRTGANVFSYTFGFALATAALHAVGLGLGFLGQRRSQTLSRALGTVCAAAGAVLLVS